MKILVINSGSSSVKFSMLKTGEDEPRVLIDGEISGIGGDGAELEIGGETSKVDASTPAVAIHSVLDALAEAKQPEPDAVGYRVVHPGAKLKQHVRITDEVMGNLEDAASFAPLHDPAVVTIIQAMRKRLPQAGHYACFDTIFHQTMPEQAYVYAVPKKYRDEGVRRYGFHGLSCESIVRRMKRETGGFPRRAVIAHLGSGCSVTALLDGKSVDTSMGLTPTGGVVMGTRPGDLDPGLVLYLVRQGSVDDAEKMLNRDAGLIALSGMKNDVKAVREAAGRDDANARLALDVFTRSVRKAIGGYAWLLGGLDAIIFAGGIGEHDAATRSEVLTGLEETGVRLGEDTDGKGMRKLSAEGSKTAVWVVPAEEDLMIAVHVQEMSAQQ